MSWFLYLFRRKTTTEVISGSSSDPPNPRSERICLRCGAKLDTAITKDNICNNCFKLRDRSSLKELNNTTNSDKSKQIIKAKRARAQQTFDSVVPSNLDPKALPGSMEMLQMEKSSEKETVCQTTSDQTIPKTQPKIETKALKASKSTGVDSSSRKRQQRDNGKESRGSEDNKAKRQRKK